MNNTPIIHLIAALAETNRVIGNAGAIPWHIPEDMAHFKTTTMGCPVIMGRKTFESIGRPLPGRTNIIVTSQSEMSGGIVAHSIEEAIEIAGRESPTDVYVIGGGQIYAQALPLADELNLTLVRGDFEGDAFFPPYDEFTQVIKKEDHLDSHPPFSFVTLRR